MDSVDIFYMKFHEGNPSTRMGFFIRQGKIMRLLFRLLITSQGFGFIQRSIEFPPTQRDINITAGILNCVEQFPRAGEMGLSRLEIAQCDFSLGQTP